jgi:CRISPR-associated protein Cmr1
MHKITFECETITPMFLSGANQKEAELRPPSIKGALRFWWRAMNGHLDLKTLKEREGEIFGDTGRRSAFSIRVIEQPDDNQKDSLPTLPHKKSAYKNCIKEKTKFMVRLALMRGCGLSEAQLIALFQITTTLGSLGNRSRRGFGAFTITAIKKTESGKTEVLPLDLPSSPEEILKLINKISPSFNWNQNNVGHNYPYLREVNFGTNKADLTHHIGKQSSLMKKTNDDNWDYRNALGHTTSKRLASPVYVSATILTGKIVPITSVFNTERTLNRNSQDIQDEFIKNVL